MNRSQSPLWVSLVAAVALAACGEKTKPSGGAAPSASASAVAPAKSTWTPTDRDAALSAGKAVLDKHECTRCHKIDDLKDAARPLACASCHVFLTGLKPEERQYRALVEKYGEEVMKRYQRNIAHLIRVPDLSMVARRVRPSFLASYLREPFDLRPSLEESMIRHKLSDDEQRAVVRYFAAKADAADPFTTPDPPLPKAVDAARLDAGKRLFLTKGCPGCHTFGNLDTGVSAETLKKGGFASALAPNLRFVRDRTRLDALVPWLLEPQKLAEGTLMPAMGLTREEAETLADFLLHGDASVKPVVEVPEPPAPKVLDEKVSWETVKEEVLGKICVHCHMNDYEKDPGPGNKGGLGFKGTGLQMRTYESLVSGAVGADGKRFSVLEKRGSDAYPSIVAVMLDRRREEPRDHTQPFDDHARPAYPKTLGMPLGLPSMNDRQISLVATWIAQGCPGPKGVTGKPGIDDGYLVPDGPIKKNRGCELRAPDAKRPTWAVDVAKP